MREPSAVSPLLHPISLGALVLLLINDHVLKVQVPSVITGKLSDVAFMILAPLFLWTLLANPPWRRMSRSAESQPRYQAFSRRVLGASILATGGFFAVMQCTEAGDWAFRYALGGLQWPLRCLSSLAMTGQPARFAVVQATPDVSDLFCLPFLAVPWLLVSRYEAAAGQTHAVR